MIKIVIADDHSLIREGLKSRLEKSAIDIKVVAEASTAAGLQKQLKELRPDIVILDIILPDKNGLDVLKELKLMHPYIEVIVLSMHPEERYAVRSYKAGAAGYLSKNKENLSDELIKAIRIVGIQKRRYVSEDVASKLAEYIHDPALGNKKHQELSDREFQVFCLIAMGKPIREIAHELSITIQTVYTYRNRAKVKLSLETDADFTRYAMQHNLID